MRLSSTIALCVGSITISGSSAAQSKDECSPAYTQTQVLRKQGDLIGARTQALVCSAPVCKYESADCTQWLAELEAAIPTVVIALKDADGRDVVDAHVTIDGKPALGGLDAKAVPLNPGPHVVQFQASGQVVEAKLLLREGERLRTITGQLQRKDEPLAPQPQPLAPHPTTPGPDTTNSGGVPAWAWIAGGLGIASAGVGVGFLVAQFGGQSEIDDNCSQQPPKPGYSPDDCDSLRVDNNVRQGLAGGLLGVGAIGIGVAIFGIATASSARPEPVTGFWGVAPEVTAGPGRVQASLSRSF